MGTETRSVIIIGAGLAGLAAGISAQTNGYQSHIFEHHTTPGGVAAWWKRGDYLIDGGIHFVMGHRPGTKMVELYRGLGIVPSCRFVDMTTYGHFVEEASGRSVLVTGDLERLAADLKAIAPADGRAVDELIAGARRMQGFDMSEVGISKPPELMGPLDQLKDLWGMRRFFRYFSGKYARPVAEYVRTIQEPWLRRCIENLFLPEVPVWFILMILALLADGQLGLLEGGCADFVLPMEQRYRELGGEVTYRATVEEILVEDDRAVGVRLADGSQYRADAVISAADGHSTIFEMLGGRYVNDKIKDRYAKWQLCQPFFMVSYGVARTFPDEPSTHMILLECPVAVGEQAVSAISLRIFNYGSRFAPPGKTVVQAAFEADWETWNHLRQRDRAAYNAEKARVAAELLARLERHYPGISAQVEMTDVATPATTYRYTLNQQGAWGGWLMTADIATAQIERTLPGLDNFVMAGQWVTPGGGVPTSLYSGRHAIQLLCHRDRRPYVSRLSG